MRYAVMANSRLANKNMTAENDTTPCHCAEAPSKRMRGQQRGKEGIPKVPKAHGRR